MKLHLALYENDDSALALLIGPQGAFYWIKTYVDRAELATDAAASKLLDSATADAVRNRPVDYHGLHSCVWVDKPCNLKGWLAGVVQDN
jgi:hypothetical protein